MSEEPHTKAGDVVDAAFEWCERLGLACMVMHQDGRVLRLTEGWPAIEGSVSSRDAPGLSSHRREIARDAVSSGRLDGTLSSERLSRCTPAWAEALSRQMRADRPGKFVFAMADHSRISGKLARDGRAVLVHLGATCRKDEMVVA